MPPFSRNFFFGVIIAILLVTTIVFGALLVRMKQEARSKSQEVRKLKEQTREVGYSEQEMKKELGQSVKKMYVADIPQDKKRFDTSRREVFFKAGEKLYVFDTNTSQTSLITDNLSSDEWRGPIVSPLTAYTDNSRRLLFVSDSSGHRVLLTSQLQNLIDPQSNLARVVVDILGWSPDYSKLFYSLTEGGPDMGGPPESLENITIPEDLLLGFYIADFKEGKIYHIDFQDERISRNFGSFEYAAWLDNNSLLFQKEIGAKKVLLEYDFSSSRLFPFTRFGPPWGAHTFGFGQVSANEQKQITYIEGEPAEPSYVSINFYNNGTNMLVKKGAWGENQWPLLSPDGKYIVFQGPSLTEISLYHSKTYSVEKLLISISGKKRSVGWLNNSQIVVEVGELYQPMSLLLYDVNTKKVIPLLNYQSLGKK